MSQFSLSSYLDHRRRPRQTSLTKMSQMSRSYRHPLWPIERHTPHRQSIPRHTKISQMSRKQYPSTESPALLEIGQ